MSSSTSKFFAIPELIDTLTSQLPRADTRLARTNKQLYARRSPSLYKWLDDYFTDKKAIFNSIPGMLALGRNIRHVRKMSCGRKELAFYYNCVLAFEELSSQTMHTHAPRPGWLPPADAHPCRLVPLPPMTHLSDLSLWFGAASRRPNPSYTLPSVDNPHATLAQACWLISLNPHLTTLRLSSFTIMDFQGFQLFVRAIAGLSKLKTLDGFIICKGDYWHQAESELFFSCPPSLQTFVVTASPFSSSNPSTQNMVSLWRPSIDNQDGGSNAMLTPRRENPLTKLVSLGMWNVESSIPTSEILSVIKHCPNVKELTLPNLASCSDVDVIWAFIGQHCPSLRLLNCTF
ncbi:hypothetical protein BGX23_004587 [Mortierella sp. AD031]|nr:hypothetical protein BGX23_004587 [Mortierella sp. AD031]